MASLEVQIAEIEQWDRGKRLEVWTKLTSMPPGARLSTRFLRRALIFERQYIELGGHSAAVKRSLKANAVSLDAGVVRLAAALSSGTQLVREWNGRIYRVNVCQDGFELDGRHFTSLSAVAKQITGAQWSGPRFFGLKGSP